MNNLGIISAEIPKNQAALRSTKEILNEPTVKVITPSELESIRKLLDVNVDRIKELVKKIGDITNLIYLYQQRNFFLYDNSNFI